MVPEDINVTGDLTATQLGNSQPSNLSDEEIHDQLHETNLKSLVVKIEKFILRLVSGALVIHGLYGLYNELIEIFYVFPHLPQVFKDLGYADVAYQSLYRKSILVTSAAAIETIYGLAVIANLEKLVHRLHIISGLSLLTISILLARENRSFEELDIYHRIPESPSIHNLWQAETNQERLELFKSLNHESE